MDKQSCSNPQEREIKRILPVVDKIEALSDQYRSMSDEVLRQAPEFKRAFGRRDLTIFCRRHALVRETSDRVLGKDLSGCSSYVNNLHQGRMPK